MPWRPVKRLTSGTIKRPPWHAGRPTGNSGAGRWLLSVLWPPPSSSLRRFRRSAGHPKTAASLAESQRLASEADRSESAAEKATLLRRAIAAEPENRDARLALADALFEDHHPDDALAMLAAFRDAGWRECLHELADYVWNAAKMTDDPAVREKLLQLATSLHGPRTRVTAAAESVWQAFADREWNQLAPYVGTMTRVHVEGSLGDPPADWTERLSPRALRSWFNRHQGYDLRRGENWLCDARCCEYWSTDPGRGDDWFSLTRACFATTGARATWTAKRYGSPGAHNSTQPTNPVGSALPPQNDVHAGIVLPGQVVGEVPRARRPSTRVGGLDPRRSGKLRSSVIVKNEYPEITIDPSGNGFQ